MLGTCEDVEDGLEVEGLEVAVVEVDGVVSGAIVTVTEGASEVVELVEVVGSGRALGLVGIGNGGRSGRDGWLDDEDEEEAGPEQPTRLPRLGVFDRNRYVVFSQRTYFCIVMGLVVKYV